jgi:DNA replication and repair protein RecF
MLTMHGNLLKNLASQGQKKSFLLALKLAEYEMLQNETKSIPLLLLDDIFERLDDNRMEKLFSYIHKNMDGQVFITDTNRERLEKHLAAFSLDYSIEELGK